MAKSKFNKMAKKFGLLVALEMSIPAKPKYTVRGVVHFHSFTILGFYTVSSCAYITSNK